VHVQRKCAGNLIQDSTFMIEILTGIQLGIWMRNAFYNDTLNVKNDYVRWI
jgi:hypothetical protein